MKQEDYIRRELERHTEETVKAAYEIAEVINKYEIPMREMCDIFGILQVIMVAKCAGM